MIKIHRSYPAPASLALEEKKKTGAYNLPDVTERLRKDFFDKCYICEIKPVADPEVEHRLPHKNNSIPGRKYNWDNLFWSCRHCNSVKANPKYDQGILDCCTQDPEEYLTYCVTEKNVEAKAFDSSQKDAVLTAQLITEVFNRTNTGIRIAACDTRVNQLLLEMNKLYVKLEDYCNEPGDEFTLRSIRAMLKRESAFAGFKRSYIREHLEEYPEFRAFLD